MEERGISKEMHSERGCVYCFYDEDFLFVCFDLLTIFSSFLSLHIWYQDIRSLYEGEQLGTFGRLWRKRGNIRLRPI